MPIAAGEALHLLAQISMLDNQAMLRIRDAMRPQSHAYRAQVLERLGSMISAIAAAEQP